MIETPEKELSLEEKEAEADELHAKFIERRIFDPAEAAEAIADAKKLLGRIIEVPFTIGEVIKGRDSDIEADVSIEITKIFDDTGDLEAKVISLGNFFSSDRLKGGQYDSHGFVLGETLLLERHACLIQPLLSWVPGSPPSPQASVVHESTEQRIWWNVKEPKQRPWHSIYLHEDGTKSFDHYR